MSLKEKNVGIIALAEEILRNVELSELPLSSIVLKCVRLARLTADDEAQTVFHYELVGYPRDPTGEFVLHEAFNLARRANRTYFSKDPNVPEGPRKEYMFPQTVGELEATLESAKEQMKVALDRSVSVSSANPSQYLMTPMGNALERSNLRSTITETSKKIDQLRAGYYSYVLGVYNSYKFGKVVDEIFHARQQLVDNWMAEKLPETSKKFVSVYENLQSTNEEDWANAVHSCRRALKDMADLLYPPNDKEIDVGDGRKIKLSEENYIARLKEYIKSKSASASFDRIVGSHLDFVGDRIDSIYRASTKGSHATIDRLEAERYVIFTYLLIGDILPL